MSELPRGWAESRIGELCVLVNGRAFKPSDWCASGLPIIRIQNLNRPDASFNHFDKPVQEKFLVKNGDLLFAWSGTPGTSFGAHIWDGPDAILNQHIFNVRFDERVVDKAFFRYAINQTLDEQIAKAHGGVGLRHVTKGKFEDTSIALPPLPEQRRIVAKIDGLSAKSKRARDHLDHIPRLVEKYKQAILAAAFRGELTREWRNSFGISPPDILPIKTMCLSITDGDHQAPPRADTGIPFITISAMNDGAIDLRKATRFVPQSYLDSLRPERRAHRGDVLYSVTGSFGIPAMVDFDETFVFQRHIAILKPNRDKVEPRFLFRLLAAPQVLEQAFAVATGTAQKTVPLSGLRNFVVPWPPLGEQNEALRLIETAFTWIDRIKTEVTSANKLIGHLDQTILAKAFSGELVPQDPNDEPAAALLERIKAEREAEPRGYRRQQA